MARHNPWVLLKPAPRRVRASAAEWRLGIRTEREHTRSRPAARLIAAHHLVEHPRYYSKVLLPAERRARRNPVDDYGVEVTCIPWHMPPGKARFVTTCTNSTYELIASMQSIAQEITRRQFLRYLAPGQIQAAEADLGYDRSFTMTRDWHVGYFRSFYDGRPCVYFCHSHVEWIFQ